MTTYEIISIVSISCTALIAISAIIIPLILEFLKNKAKIEIQNKKLYFNHYQEIIDNFSIAYGEWKYNNSYKLNLLKMIYNTMPLCKPQIKELLSNLAKLTQENNTSEETDKLFFTCLDWLQNSLNEIGKSNKLNKNQINYIHL